MGDVVELLVYPKLFRLADPAVVSRVCPGATSGPPPRWPATRAGPPASGSTGPATPSGMSIGGRRPAAAALLVREFEPSATWRIAVFADIRVPGADRTCVSVDVAEFLIAVTASVVADVAGTRGRHRALLVGHRAGSPGGPGAERRARRPARHARVAGPGLARTGGRSIGELLLSEGGRLGGAASVVVVATDFPSPTVAALAAVRRRLPVTAIWVRAGEGHPPPRGRGRRGAGGDLPRRLENRRRPGVRCIGLPFRRCSSTAEATWVSLLLGAAVNGSPGPHVRLPFLALAIPAVVAVAWCAAIVRLRWRWWWKGPALAVGVVIGARPQRRPHRRALPVGFLVVDRDRAVVGDRSPGRRRRPGWPGSRPSWRGAGGCGWVSAPPSFRHVAWSLAARRGGLHRRSSPGAATITPPPSWPTPSGAGWLFFVFFPLTAAAAALVRERELEETLAGPFRGPRPAWSGSACWPCRWWAIGLIALLLAVVVGPGAPIVGRGVARAAVAVGAGLGAAARWLWHLVPRSHPRAGTRRRAGRATGRRPGARRTPAAPRPRLLHRPGRGVGDHRRRWLVVACCTSSSATSRPG